KSVIFVNAGPQWARKESRNATQILRAGNDAPTTKRESLVTGSGERRIWARSAHPEPSPGAFCLLFRHGKRRSPPVGGEILCEKPTKRRAGSSRPTKRGDDGEIPCALKARKRRSFPWSTS